MRLIASRRGQFSSSYDDQNIDVRVWVAVPTGLGTEEDRLPHDVGMATMQLMEEGLDGPLFFRRQTYRQPQRAHSQPPFSNHCSTR